MYLASLTTTQSERFKQVHQEQYRIRQGCNFSPCVHSKEHFRFGFGHRQTESYASIDHCNGSHEGHIELCSAAQPCNAFLRWRPSLEEYAAQPGE